MLQARGETTALCRGSHVMPVQRLHRCRGFGRGLVPPAYASAHQPTSSKAAGSHSGTDANLRWHQSSNASAAWTTPVTVTKDKVMLYENLQGDDFRHPLDQQNTSLLRSVPGLEVVSKTLLGPAAEQVLLLENIATSIKIGPEQLPSVYRLLIEAAEILQMEPPELYVRQNPIPNAYTLAIAGRQPFIVIHTALLELLTPRELQAVLAHELGHLKCDHGVWLTVANVLASGTVSVLPVVSGMVEEALMRWLRAAELTCDRAALLVAQDSKVVVASLMKLAGGSPSFASELNVDAFLEQARSYEEATNSILGWYLRNAQTRALSHPLPVMRAREIDRWAHSAEYRNLLTKNRAHKVQYVEYLSPREASVLGGAASAGNVAEVQPDVQPASKSTIAHVSSSVWGSQAPKSNGPSTSKYASGLDVQPTAGPATVPAASSAFLSLLRRWLPWQG